MRLLGESSKLFVVDAHIPGCPGCGPLKAHGVFSGVTLPPSADARGRIPATPEAANEGERSTLVGGRWDRLGGAIQAPKLAVGSD